MGSSLKWVGIILATIAGVMIGFALTTVAYRYRILRIPGGHGFVDRLDHELKLNPDQRHQIQDLVRDTRIKMEQLHQDCRLRHDQLILQTHGHIRDLLTPDQQQRFDREFTPPIGRDRDRDHHGPDD